jgi:hypothetical protein
MKFLAVAALVFVLTACGSSAKHASSAVKITSFDVPASVTCGAAPSTTVRISYSVTGAQQQSITVDGREVPGTGAPTATVTAPIHCDPLEHDVALIATDAHGVRTSQVKHLTTLLSG